ncbi:mitochondrial metalloendopeptidase OMA1 [Cordyceps fumosorosea ARSEF 2679]|uniref:Mitochondrial metalloendopeptidase OMA1 n=1 Tax=Cordyceps fumosorosea (strain ARSEF 2679) TaxID=1081104 RepID=A0A162JNN0_CORFA|nr:mitochondrial metalloendopeptidase OMA1 [Cordyceps fumosorosea ARSEF 2679]OAA71542.1 mitochondrial metalloendopeptidase OMA1 [Cordyceps fumosorosea ARSEF 2679]
MSATVRLARGSRIGLLRAPKRPTVVVEPCRACALPAEPHRALCSSTPRATQQERGPLYSRKTRQSSEPQRVTGTWERPSDFSRPRAQYRAEEEAGYHHNGSSGGGGGTGPRRTAREAASGPQSKAAVVTVMLAAVAFYVWNSQTVPLTGRWRFNFLSDEIAERMHPGAVQSILKQVYESGGFILGDGDVRTRIVKRVMRRLIPVSGLADLNWEIYVIADDSQANAFVLPGGKVFVFSGLLRVCGNEDALAAVLGHEIAHQTASHSAERLSQAWVGNLTTGSLFFLVGTLPGLALFAIWMATGAFVLPALMYELPMSRAHEYEADHIGLMMMAEACYDPRAAIPFWRRMSENGQEMDEVLSTHPSNEHRVAKLTQLMPEALAKREQSDCRGTESFARRFRLAVKQRQREMPRTEEM